jgi:hypothetical protein
LISSVSEGDNLEFSFEKMYSLVMKSNQFE